MRALEVKVPQCETARSYERRSRNPGRRLALLGFYLYHPSRHKTPAALRAFIEFFRYTPRTPRRRS